MKRLTRNTGMQNAGAQGAPAPATFDEYTAGSAAGTLPQTFDEYMAVTLIIFIGNINALHKGLYQCYKHIGCGVFSILPE